MFSKKYSPSRLVLFGVGMVLVFVVGCALTEAAFAACFAACAVLVLGIAWLDDMIEDSKRFPSLKFVWKSVWKTMKFAFWIIVFCVAVGSAWLEVTSPGTMELKNEAGKGNPDAQFNLGRCYENGEGVEQSWVVAAAWYRKAAEQGNAAAQLELGRCYGNGKGVEQSWEKAVKWFRKSAEQGNAAAQNILGVCYAGGEGVEQSWAEAVKWCRKAAEQGNADAQYNLGWCYGKTARVSGSRGRRR